jgi:hypothetical protein
MRTQNRYIKRSNGPYNIYLQWTQNNSELELRHSKRCREDLKGKGSMTIKSLSEHV